MHVCRLHCTVDGIRKESPALSFPLVAWSEADVVVGGLVVHGIMDKDLTRAYAHM